jgi:DNA-binding PadR family transcriptional regulator
MDDKLLLLGLLRREGMHGYGLYEFIEQNLSVCTDLKKPTAYYLLNRMAEDGWIEVESTQAGNRPPKRVYRLTDKGEAAFQQLLRENLSSYHPAYFTGDIGLALLDGLEPGEARLLLDQRRAALETALAAARSAPEHPGRLQWVIEHQRRHLQVELDWLDEVLARLQ